MASRERPADRGRRKVRRALRQLTEDVRAARVGAGLSQQDVTTAVGVSHARIGRLERNELRDPAPDLLAAACAVVGLELVLRAYPAGDPLRDRAHGALLERLRRVLHPTVRFRAEQPLPLPGDLRAWDAVISGRGWTAHVEAETALADTQALARRLLLKVRDGGAGCLILLIADTRLNRERLPLLRRLLGEFLPLDGRRALGALRQGRDPGANGIVVI